MAKILYILSLPHSGSTILDYYLSFHKDVLGLGEIYSILKNKRFSFEQTHSICSCGSDIVRCEFWSLFQEKRDKSVSYLENYQTLLNLASKLGKSVIVDSSKDISHLEPIIPLFKDGQADLHIVFLIRDARGWAKSITEIEKKRGKFPKPYFYWFYLWYKRNKEMQEFLRKNKLKFIQISYEEFCFKPQESINKILKFAGLPLESFSLDNKPNTHIAFGNRVKKDSEKIKNILYDRRWQKDRWLRAVFFLLPYIYFWNRKNVWNF